MPIGFALGSGVPKETGAKAYHLDLSLRLGLAVPQGRAYVMNVVGQSASFAEDVLTHLTGGTYAVRSSFRGEDSATQSQAGRYDSFLFVKGEDLAEAFAKVYRSAGPDHQGPQGIVVQRMVDAENAGVLFIQPDFLDPLMSWVSGTADKLVGGEVEGEREELAPQVTGFKARVRLLAELVRQLLPTSELGWDVEWADDGQTTWLVQARPITVAPQRDELFSYANIREIMPDPPSTFMASVVEEAGLSLYQYYRNFDPKLPRARPIIELQLGRPLFNISLFCETMRHWGLPTRLVTDQIGGADVAKQGFQLGRFISKLDVIARQGLSQLQAVSMTCKAMEELRQFEVADNLAELGVQVTQLFERLGTVMFDLTAAMAVPLTLLRRLDVLGEHSAQHQTPTGQILRALSPLRKLVAQRPEWHDTLRLGQSPESPEFQAAWQEYLQSYGHRGFFESDLAEPRFAEEPETILISLLSKALPERYDSLSWKARLSWPLWVYTRRILDTREHWRDQAMLVYQDLRKHILMKSVHLGLDEPQDIFALTLQEWAKIDEGWEPSSQFWQDRFEEIEGLKRYNVPDLIRRFQPRHELLQDLEPDEMTRRVSGLSLSKGTVEGTIWLAQDARDIPDVEPGEAIVLVVRTVDPGWLFSLPKIAGAIVELGGDLSHGSILLREFGVPAITNAAGATRVFQTGDRVKLVAHEGFAVRLSR